MLRHLDRILRRGRSRSAGVAVRRAFTVCVLLGLLAAPLTFVRPAGASGLASVQGEPSLAAAATMPMFVAFTVQGDPARLQISMRNTGKDTWEPAQDIRLRRLADDGTTPAGESYPLELAVQPGQAVRWDLVVVPKSAGLVDRRYAMCRGERTFGSPARAVVVVLPRLEGGSESFGSGIGGALQSVTDWAQRTFGGAISGFVSSVRGLFDGFLNTPLY